VRNGGQRPDIAIMGGFKLWSWRYTDDFGKRRIFPCRLSEEDAKRHKNAQHVEGYLEIRKPLGSTSDFPIQCWRTWLAAWDFCST
jgi:hypothetical protein